MGRPRNEEEARRLLNVAFELFSSKGIEGTSYSDIAKSAYATKSHIQHYFPKKEELIRSFVYKSMDSVLSIARELDGFDAWNPLRKLIYVDYIQFYYAMNNERMLRLSRDILLDRSITQTVIDAGSEYNLLYLLKDVPDRYVLEMEDAIRFLYGGIYDYLYDCLSKKKSIDAISFIRYGIRILAPYSEGSVTEDLLEDLSRLDPWLDEQKKKYDHLLFGI